MISLYFHIPFCEKKCIYCDFYSIEVRDRQDEFVTALIREVDVRTSESEDADVATIFFGGGTPSLLLPSQMEMIFESVRKRFRIATDPEITVECNPGTVDRSKLAAYRSLGINRLSFGVQSFFEDDLTFLSRIHSVDDACKAIDDAHDAGFENVNLDLMFSLPNQSPERWLHNLERARSLGTTHISCYSLTLEEGTPLASMVKRDAVRLASEESDAALFELTMQTLAGWGFKHYEVSNYAMAGFECRHNLNYWRHGEYLGFGPSAHSFIGSVRSWNASSLQTYFELMHKDATAQIGREMLDASKQREEFLFLGLRSEGIDLAVFRVRFGSDVLADNRGFIDRCILNGLMEIIDNRLRLTQAGFLLCDEMCAEMK